jgi:rhamnose transport system substrate-binding protein
MADQLTIAVMPKALANPYFDSCHRGAQEAAREIGVRLLWDGPTSAHEGLRQESFIERWMKEKVDVLAVSAEDAHAVAVPLRRARAAGIHVLTWDSDCAADARAFFVMPTTLQGIAKALVNAAGRVLAGRGQVAVIAASESSQNQMEAIRHIETHIAQEATGLSLVASAFCDDEQEKARTLAKDLLTRYPSVRVLIATCAPAVPGAAQAVKESGRTDVRVVGMSLPSACRHLIVDGVVDTVVLWNTVDLGFLTVVAAHAVAKGLLKPGDVCLRAGRLGTVIVQDDQVRLGRPRIFNKGNLEAIEG